MGCGASSQPYQPQEEPKEEAPPAVVPPPEQKPIEEPTPAAAPEVKPPEEIQVGDGGGAGIQLACPPPEPEGEEDGPQDRGPILPFVRFDKSAVPKELSNGQYVYIQQLYTGNYLGLPADARTSNMDCESAEMDDSRVFAVERFKGEGPVKDGDGVLLKHVATGWYAQALSDQYPVILAEKKDGEAAQVFSIFKIGNPLGIRHRDTVYLQSWLNNYVENTATITGEPVVVARKWRRTEGATFTILKRDIMYSTTTELARKMQFQAFDMDGNGGISRAEMEYMLKNIKGSAEAEELDGIMGTCDPAQTGSIPYPGFASWADGGGLTEEQLQHGEVIGNTAQRCNDALNEEGALIEVLATAGLKQCTAMKACYAEKFPSEEGPGDLPGAIEKKASEQDGWIFSSNWKLAMRALMEDEVDLWTRCLNDAMKCWGTDEYSLTCLVCTMPERLRVDIFKRYHERFGKGLLEHIESETSGNYKKVLVMQAMAPEDCKARLLYEAMKGMGTNEDQLIRVIAGADIPERRQIKEAFLRMYNQELIPWVQSETSGDFKKALTCMLEAEESEFDLEKDCEAMKAAMDGWGTDEAALIRLICSKTSRQMEMVNEKFEELYEKQLFTRVKNETSGHFQETLLGCIRHPMKQLAECVRYCVKGWGTAELGLLTMLVHLPDFKKAALQKQYREQFSRDLIADIKSDCSGNYEKALLALVRPAPRVWAEAITKSMKGLGTSDQLLINFMCIAKDEMGEVRKAFKMLNEKSLLEWVEGDCSGDYKRTMAGLANRNTEDDPTMVPLYWAQRGRDAICDVSTLKNILVALPAVAIKRGMEVYQVVYQKTLADEIGRKCSEGASWFQWSNYYKTAMLKLLKMPVELYVEGLYDAMNGIGTDEGTLTALVCTIPENMYGAIHALYKEKYGKSLLDHIESETSFAYKKAMLYQAADWPESRAMALRGAMEGLGTSEDQLTRVIICSTMKERQKIQEAYKAKYSKGLIAHIEEETSGDFQAILVAVLESCEPQPDDAFNFEEDAQFMKEAMDGGCDDADAIIRRVASKTPKQIEILKEKYKEIADGEDLYKRLEEETDSWTGLFLGDNFRNCILGLLRPPIVALACAVRDCIVGFGTDDTGLVTLLVHLSERKKADLVNAYMDIKNGGDLYAHIKGDTSGSFEGALLGLIQPAPVTWAKALRGAMKGLGTSDELLINFMCIAKDRMDEVRTAFAELNDGQELGKWIDGDCSGDYKDLLIRLANREVYKFAGSDVMVTVPPPPSQESAQYKFAKCFNRLCRKKKENEAETLVPTEEDQQEMGNVFMLYGQKSSCAPNLDKQGLWDLTNAVGFPPADDGPDLDATFEEWNYSGSGEITWNDFCREMANRANAPQHYDADPLPENAPPGEGTD